MTLGRFCTVEPASEGYGYVHSGVIGAFTSCNITVTCVYVSAVQPIASVCEASPAGSAASIVCTLHAAAKAAPGLGLFWLATWS